METPKIYLQCDVVETNNPDHLHFVSDRPFVVDDYVYIPNQMLASAQIAKVEKEADIETLESLNALKVEATTLPTLGLPRVPINFVDKYLLARRLIKTVLIELWRMFDNPTRDKYYSAGDMDSDIPHYEDMISVTKSGQVIIGNKDIWTTEELLKHCESAYQMGNCDPLSINRLSFREWAAKQLSINLF